jgi:drug/metabolite transporter (DMT)-like permease
MAILLAIVAGFAFTLSFACIKALGKDIPVQQVMFFRMFVGILVLTPMLLRAPRSIWKSSRPFGHLYRILAGFASMMLLYWAAARMPLALLTATQFMMPLFVTMLSIPLLQESVGWRRALATLLGFGGVLLMIQPGEEGILGVELAYIAAIASALFYALAVIAMRQLGRTEPVLRTTLYFSAVAALASGIACLFGWVNPTLNQWLLLICTGIAGGIGQFAMVGAYKMAPATVVAPFDYMQMVWATAIGFIIWLEIPTIHTLLGASVVILSGFYIFRREAAVRKKFA